MAQSSDTPSPAAQKFVARSYAALGDSFSEGVGDLRADGSCRGWADRVAEHMALSNPGFRYANLAIRGKLLRQVTSEQVPAAVAMRPDLVSIAAGGNDLLRPGADPDELAQPFADAVADLTAACGRVVVFTGFNPGTFPLIRMIRGKVAAFNAHLRIIAARHDCLLVDLWSMSVLCDPRLWCEDRLHMAPEGHRRVALRVCEVVGVPAEEDWRAPVSAAPAAPAPRWLAQRRADAQWARAYAAPWVRRRLSGVSSGDGQSAKRPDLLPF